MPELNGRELLDEWRKLMESVVGSAGSAAARSELPRELLRSMQRQAEMVGELLDRERGLQRDLAARFLAPVDAIFDLLESTAATLRQQSEALESAGRALEESATLMKRQAELFERTIATIRQPTDLARAAAGLQRRQPKSRAGTRRTPKA